MRFTPIGLSVRVRARSTSLTRSVGVGCVSAVMMPGKPVADAVFADLEPRVAGLRAGGRNPGLGTILVGNESASAGYIRMKQDRAASLGFGGRHVHLDDDASQADLVAAIRDFNTDDEFSVSYLLSQAAQELCPAQTWQLRQSAAGYRPT